MIVKKLKEVSRENTQLIGLSIVSIRAFDLPDAWYQVLKKIWEEGVTFVVERPKKVLTKKIVASIEIERPETRPLIHEKAPFDMKYIYSYTLEYLLTGEKRPSEPYTYGERLRKPVDQIETVIERYRKAKFDRQNTMVTRLPEDIDRDDPPCLTMIDTEILDDALHFYACFRSWDAYAGFPANLSALQLLKEEMASKIGVKPGKTFAFSKNLHIYEHQFELVKEVIKPAQGKP